MPAIPPWLQPRDPVGPYLQGFGQGASVAEHLNQVDQQARSMAAQQAATRARLAMERENMIFDALKEKARLDVEQSYKKQMLDFKEQELQNQERGTQSLVQYRQALAQKAAQGPVDPNARLLQNKNAAEAALQSASAEFASIPEGDPRKSAAQDKVQKLQRDLEFWETKAKGSGFDLNITSPSGETITAHQGPAIPQATPGVTGNIQTGLSQRGLGTKVAVQEAKYENAMQLVSDLERSLDAGDVGFTGMVKEWAGRTLGQIDPSAVNAKTMSVRNKISQLKESVAREIPEGGRETQKQRDEVLASLPERGVWESEANARAALKATRDLLTMRARNYGAEVGRLPLVAMSKSELSKDLKLAYDGITAKLKAGLISKAKASAMAKQAYDEHMDALNRFNNP